MKPDSSYSVVAHPKLQKSIRKNLPPDLKKIFDRKVNYLAENPEHPSLNTKQFNVSRVKLKELEVDEVWEFRINMSFRCIFYLDYANRLMILAYVGDHTEVRNRYK